MRKKKNDEHIVAISMAIHERLETYIPDDREMKLTIKRNEIPSAWSLKTYFLREIPKLTIL